MKRGSLPFPTFSKKQKNQSGEAVHCIHFTSTKTSESFSTTWSSILGANCGALSRAMNSYETGLSQSLMPVAMIALTAAASMPLGACALDEAFDLLNALLVGSQLFKFMTSICCLDVEQLTELLGSFSDMEATYFITIVGAELVVRVWSIGSRKMESLAVQYDGFQSHEQGLLADYAYYFLFMRNGALKINFAPFGRYLVEKTVCSLEKSLHSDCVGIIMKSAAGCLIAPADLGPIDWLMEFGKIAVLRQFVIIRWFLLPLIMATHDQVKNFTFVLARPGGIGMFPLPNRIERRSDFLQYLDEEMRQEWYYLYAKCVQDLTRNRGSMRSQILKEMIEHRRMMARIETSGEAMLNGVGTYVKDSLSTYFTATWVYVPPHAWSNMEWCQVLVVLEPSFKVYLAPFRQKNLKQVLSTALLEDTSVNLDVLHHYLYREFESDLSPVLMYKLVFFTYNLLQFSFDRFGAIPSRFGMMTRFADDTCLELGERHASDEILTNSMLD